MARHPIDSTPSSEQTVHTVQVNDWTQVALLDKELNKMLAEYGNVSSTGRFGPGCPALTSDLAGKLADARHFVLKTQLKAIASDILSFGHVQPCTEQGSTEAFQTALFKVLVSMVQTYIKVKVDSQDQVAINGQELEYCLSDVDILEFEGVVRNLSPPVGFVQRVRAFSLSCRAFGHAEVRLEGG